MISRIWEALIDLESVVLYRRHHDFSRADGMLGGGLTDATFGKISVALEWHICCGCNCPLDKRNERMEMVSIWNSSLHISSHALRPKEVVLVAFERTVVATLPIDPSLAPVSISPHGSPRIDRREQAPGSRMQPY